MDNLGATKTRKNALRKKDRHQATRLPSPNAVQDASGPMPQIVACNATPQTFCTVRNLDTGKDELLSVTTANQLLWLRPSKDAGWIQSTVTFIGTLAGPVTWLCAHYRVNPHLGRPAILTVFYGAGDAANPQPASAIQHDGSGWGPASLGQTVSAILGWPQVQPLQTFTATNGSNAVTFVYGCTMATDAPVPGSFYFIAYDPDESAWNKYYMMDLDAEVLVSAVALAAGVSANNPAGNVFFLVQPLSPIWPGLLQVASTPSAGVAFDFAAQQLDPNTVTIGYPIVQAASVPCDAEQYSLLAVDTDNSLYNRYWHNGAGGIALSGGSGQPSQVSDMAVSYTTDGSLAVIALDPTSNSCWLLLQTSQSGAGTFAWTSIGDFGTPVVAVAPTSTPRDNPTIFSFNTAGVIELITVDATTGEWTSEVVAVPPPPVVLPVTYNPIALTFSAVWNPSTQQSELVTVSDAGELAWLRPGTDPLFYWTASTTKFLGISGAPKWLSAFYTQPEGAALMLTVFYGTGAFQTADGAPAGGPAYGMQFDGTEWSSVILSDSLTEVLALPQVQPLQMIPVGDIDSAVVFLSGAFLQNNQQSTFIIGPQQGTNGWCEYWQQTGFSATAMPASITAAQIAGNNSELIIFQSTFSNYPEQNWYTGNIDYATADITTSQYIPSPSVQGTSTTLESAWAPNVSDGYMCLVFDIGGGLSSWYASATDAGFGQLTGYPGQPSAIGGMATFQTSQDMLCGYAIDQDTGNLLSLQQVSDAAVANAIAWSPLSTETTFFNSPTLAVATAPYQPVNPQMFVADQSGSIGLVTFTSAPDIYTTQSLTVPLNTWMTLNNAANGLVLNAIQAATDDTAQIVLSSAITGVLTEQWMMLSSGQIASRFNPEYCLSIDGSEVVITPLDPGGDKTQLWAFGSDGTLINQSNSQVLTSGKPGGAGGFTGLTVAPCLTSPSDSQIWATSICELPQQPLGTWIPLVSAASPPADPQAISWTGIDGHLNIAPYTNAQAQQWMLTTDGFILLQANPSLCLTVAGTSVEAGPLSIPPISSQQWETSSTGVITNTQTGLVLTAQGNPLSVTAVQSPPSLSQLWSTLPVNPLPAILQQAARPFPTLDPAIDGYLAAQFGQGAPGFDLRAQYTNLAAPLGAWSATLQLLERPKGVSEQSWLAAVRQLSQELTAAIAVRQLFQYYTHSHVALFSSQQSILNQLIDDAQIETADKVSGLVGDIIWNIVYVLGQTIPTAKMINPLTVVVNIIQASLNVAQSAKTGAVSDSFEIEVSELWHQLEAGFDEVLQASAAVETTLLSDWGRLQSAYGNIVGGSLAWNPSVMADIVENSATGFITSTLQLLLPTRFVILDPGPGDTFDAPSSCQWVDTSGNNYYIHDRVGDSWPDYLMSNDVIPLGLATSNFFQGGLGWRTPLQNLAQSGQVLTQIVNNSSQMMTFQITCPGHGGSGATNVYPQSVGSSIWFIANETNTVTVQSSDGSVLASFTMDSRFVTMKEPKLTMDFQAVGVTIGTPIVYASRFELGQRWAPVVQVVIDVD